MERTRGTATAHRARTGWIFVAAQVVLLVTLVALPTDDHWSVPTWLHAGGLILVVVGVVVVGVAALRLGPALTPTPVPTEDGTLATTGLYRLVRHPIYTGVLAAVIGVTVRSGNLVTVGVAVATLVFFRVKAGWEERHLIERYPEYRGYADRTPRFIPRPARGVDVGSPGEKRGAGS